MQLRGVLTLFLLNWLCGKPKTIIFLKETYIFSFLYHFIHRFFVPLPLLSAQRGWEAH